MILDLKTLDELERLSNEGTPGPFSYHASNTDWFVGHEVKSDSLRRSVISVTYGNMSDLQFFILARNRFPDLIQAIRKMRHALGFYAENLRASRDFDDVIITPALIRDAGETARVCLKELGLE